MEPAANEDDLTSGLRRLLRPTFGADVVVEELRRLSGGASRETWAFTATSGSDRRDLILQRTRPGPSASATPMEIEDRVMAAAAAFDLPLAPVVVDVATATPIIGEARVTAHVPGETLGRRIVRAERSEVGRRLLVEQMADALAAIHRVDPDDVRGLARRDPIPLLRAGLDGLGVARPAFELALRWLEVHRPERRPLAVVHGDFRVGNLMIDGDDLRAVLDWELCHLGDPLEDLGWLCIRAWRFGGAGEVGGLAPLDVLIDAYAAATGHPVDPEAVRWWMVAGTLTWGLICAVQAQRHLGGHVRSVELAMIGRRITENEYDVLDLIGLEPVARSTTSDVGPPVLTSSRPDAPDAPVATSDRSGPPVVPDAGSDLHGRPTAVELVAAVRDHLSREVAPRLDEGAAYHLRVAGHALGVVARQLELGPALDATHRERLAAIGVADEAQLADRLRRGEGADDPDVVAAVRAAVVDRLRVANPAWLLPPDA